jgi:hypothetical protein
VTRQPAASKIIIVSRALDSFPKFREYPSNIQSRRDLFHRKQAGF